jgi:hypothetical protein
MLRRYQYAAISFGCFVTFVSAALLGSWADGRHTSWLTHGCVAAVGLSLGLGLVMLGRAVLPDRVRRKLYRVPPEELS